MWLLPLFLVLALALLAALAALNLDALQQVQPLNLGWQTVQAPVGLVLLGLAALVLLLAAVGAAVAALAQRRRHQALAQSLEAQRSLAERAEASRLTQLQRQIELQAQAAEHRERQWQLQSDQQFEHLRQVLQQQIDEVGNSLAACIGEVEDRLERRRLLRPADPDRQPAGRH